MPPPHPDIPPEIIEIIVLHIILSNDSFQDRQASFSALTLLCRQWSLPARRLQHLRLEITGWERLGRLIIHLKSLQDGDLRDSTPYRVPPRSLDVVVDDGPTVEGQTTSDHLSELFRLIELSHLEDLKIQVPPTRRRASDFTEILPPNTTGHPTFPRLSSITFSSRTDFQLSGFVMACDFTRLKSISLLNGPWQHLPRTLHAAGKTLPNLESITTDIFWNLDWASFGGVRGVEDPLTPNVETIVFAKPWRAWHWPLLVKRFENSLWPKLKHIQFSVETGGIGGEWDVWSATIPFAKQKGYTLSITVLHDLEPFGHYVVTPDSQMPNSDFAV